MAGVPILSAAQRAFVAAYVTSGGSLAEALRAQSDPAAVAAEASLSSQPDEFDPDTGLAIIAEPLVPSGRLTERQRAFVREYVAEPHLSRAAVRAGLPASAGRALLNIGAVASAVAEERRSSLAEAGVRQADVLRELTRIAMADPIDVVHPDGSLKTLHEMPERARRTVQSVEIATRPVVSPDGSGVVMQSTVARVRFWDKLSALDKLAKHLGLLADRPADESPDDAEARRQARLRIMAELDAMAVPAPLSVTSGDG